MLWLAPRTNARGSEQEPDLPRFALKGARRVLMEVLRVAERPHDFPPVAFAHIDALQTSQSATIKGERDGRSLGAAGRA